MLRWLWRDWQTDIEVKANPKGESKWKGYEVVEGEWEIVKGDCSHASMIVSESHGNVVWMEENLATSTVFLSRLSPSGKPESFGEPFSPTMLHDITFGKDDCLFALCSTDAPKDTVFKLDRKGIRHDIQSTSKDTLSVAFDSVLSIAAGGGQVREWPTTDHLSGLYEYGGEIALSPDQTTLYQSTPSPKIVVWQYGSDGSLNGKQDFCKLQLDFEGNCNPKGLCVDTEGRLYVATSLGIQVCDQAGRVNFIIPTPTPALDVCFGGKDLGELFIACGDAIYKRPMKVRGVVSGQQTPIKPAPPKL